jgi:hypothetical protein
MVVIVAYIFEDLPLHGPSLGVFTLHKKFRSIGRKQKLQALHLQSSIKKQQHKHAAQPLLEQSKQPTMLNEFIRK